MNLKQFCGQLVGRQDVAAEVGPSIGLSGEVSQTLAKHVRVLHCIDAWPGGDADFDEATRHYENIVKVRGIPLPAAFADRYFHLLYLHTCTPAALMDWWPKLRQGGMLVGPSWEHMDEFFGQPDEALEDGWAVRKQPGRMRRPVPECGA